MTLVTIQCTRIASSSKQAQHFHIPIFFFVTTPFSFSQFAESQSNQHLPLLFCYLYNCCHYFQDFSSLLFNCGLITLTKTGGSHAPTRILSAVHCRGACHFVTFITCVRGRVSIICHAHVTRCGIAHRWGRCTLNNCKV